MSKLNVDTIEPEGASTTLTLGASGDTVDLSNAAVTLPDSAYLANRNRIINGAMQIAQRGTTGTAGAGGSYLACDRWKAWDASDAAVTVSQEADGPTGQFTKCLKYNITTADASITVSQFGMIRQMIEGNNIIGLGFGTASAQSVTISFWVKSSLTGSHGGALNNGNEDRSYPFAYTVSSADTWEKKSVTISGDTSGTWDTDSTAGMIVTFGLGTGTTYQGTADEWQAGNYFQPSGTIQNIGTISNWNVTGVQLEIGDTATPFEHKTYGQELAACQRYCEKLHGDTAIEMVSMQFAYNTTATEGILYYLLKRANPTITQYSTGASGWKISYSTSASVLSAVPTFDLITLTNSRITASISSGLTALQGCYLRTDEDTSYIIVDAEL